MTTCPEAQAATTGTALSGSAAGYTCDDFSAEVAVGTLITRSVLRAPRLGPSVIVIHEATGLTERTLGIAERLAGVGLTPVLPVLAGRPIPGRLESAQIFKTICTAALFGAWSSRAPASIVSWLDALAEHEYDLSRRRPVGVIGMCFSGGYALAMALRPQIGAAVASQPAFPVAIPGRRRRLGIRPGDVAELSKRTGLGASVRALRFQCDPLSPAARQRELHDSLPRADIVTIPTRNPLNHSVLAKGVTAPPQSRLASELIATVEFLRRRLLDDAPDAIEAEGGRIPSDDAADGAP